MEPYSAEKAARVWQRVRGEAPAGAPAQPSPRELMLLEAEAETAFIHLARQFPGSASRLQQLARNARRCRDCLGGICRLREGKCPRFTLPPPRDGGGLRRCCGRSLRAVNAYRALSADPEYGTVYAALAEEKQQQLREVLELLGTLDEV